ncbi:MAG TPA: triose-phosphate isomerase [Limosilactobacillus pontis]|nr:triose-phosphate isomerase [Limosilactobacillus pontis]
MVIRMLKSTMPAPQAFRPLPLRIDTVRGITAIADYAWIECRSEGGRLANRNVKRALAAQRPLLVCLDEGEQHLAPLDFAATIITQLAGALHGVNSADLGHVTVAYWPQWSQVCWLPADAQRIRVAHRQIRDILASLYDRELARRVMIVYAGPVLDAERATVMNDINVDGVVQNPFGKQNIENEVKK